jgi:ATP phosphoribosyltransferase
MRLSLPSKGRLSDEALRFLADCGLSVYKPNPRQYEATVPALPELRVLFQRPGDIVVSVREGSVDFGITGRDVVEEKKGRGQELLILHDRLGFGNCALFLAVPESWTEVNSLAELKRWGAARSQPVRVATKFPRLTGQFLAGQQIAHELISAEGTLETAPSIGYADIIADLVSSGQTLKDNRLKTLTDGLIQDSEAVLIANRAALNHNPELLEVARKLLEFIEAHQRATENLAIFANIRGKSSRQIAEAIFQQETIGGLQGPTISPVHIRGNTNGWYAVNIVVRRDKIFEAVAELRAIGGSGVVVLPVTYIFEEEPPRFTAMLAALKQ